MDDGCQDGLRDTLLRGPKAAVQKTNCSNKHTHRKQKAVKTATFGPFLGLLTNNPALAFANVPCPCQRYFLGGEGAWDHINSCLHHGNIVDKL